MSEQKVRNRPEISVIVPVYRVEKYLNDCIDSILAQPCAMPQRQRTAASGSSTRKTGA